MVQQERSEEADRLDDLRRRLYRPDSTEDDLQRYLRERSITIDADPAEPAPPAARRSRRVEVAAAVALAAVLGIGLAASLGRGGSPPIAVAPTARTTVEPAVLQDVGEGQTLAVSPGTVSAATPVPTTVRGAAVVGQLYEGRGNGIVAVDPPAGAPRSGRTMVLLTANGTVPVAWRALLTVTRADWSSYSVVMARGMSAELPGTPTPETFVWANRPPTRLAVAAPTGVRWSLLIANGNGTGQTTDLG